MSTAIFYYTGTGNSLWAARNLAEGIGGAELFSIAELKEKEGGIRADTIGLVFPVYIWGVPAPIIRFVNKLHGIKPAYIFAIAVNGGQVANTLVQLKSVMSKMNLSLSAGYEITMPSNYIPWGGPGPEEKQRNLFNQAREKITRIVNVIKDKRSEEVEKGPLWQRVVFSMVYAMSFKHVPKADRSFRADEKCNGCGVCAQVCPAANVSIEQQKPRWNRRCEQCFACLQWCPKEAVQFGKNTHRYERYHHPEVVLKDILKSR